MSDDLELTAPGLTCKPKTMQQGHSDDFQTPRDALEPLFPYLPPHWHIWEPSCGQGSLVAGFLGRGYACVGTDVRQAPQFDFLGFRLPYFDAIVTNPPYSIKDEFLARCYELGKPFALLLPLAVFDSQKRQALFRRHGVEVIFLPRRVTFTTPSGKKGGAWFACCWVTHGLGIGQQMTFWQPQGALEFTG